MSIISSAFVDYYLRSNNQTLVGNDTTSAAATNDLDHHNLNPSETWNKVDQKLKTFYGERIYKSWLKSLQFVKFSSGRIVLSVPTGFIREWISTNYSSNILELWKLEDKTALSLELQVRERKAPSPIANNDAIQQTDNQKVFDIKEIEGLSAPLEKGRTFSNFVVGKPNELAFAAAKRVAESEFPVQGSNPLFLYGGVGLGKTHLMHAIAWHIREHYQNRRVIYLSAEKFMYKYITALKNKDIMTFKQMFRSVDVLMVDDVQFISGKESTQEEFFHTFNSLIDQNKQLVISADRSPNDLEGVEDRIKSRLSWGLVADINHTTFELRMGILESKLEIINSNIIVPKKVIEFMARNIISNVRELEGALNKIIAHGSLTGGQITIESAKEVLSDILRTNSVVVTMEDIQLKVSEYYNVKISDLRSNRRLKYIAHARQICMYLAKLLTQKSLLEIGKFFGGRDHATVIHAVKRIESLAKNNTQIIEDINILTKKLK